MGLALTWGGVLGGKLSTTIVLGSHMTSW
jgi:hypothetical protein